MDIAQQLAQAALDEQDARQRRENAVAAAAGVGRVRNGRGRLVDTIAVGPDADIAVVSERTWDGADFRTIYQVVIGQSHAARRVHLSLDLALIHLVEIRVAIANGAGFNQALHGRAYTYAARVLEVPETD